MVMMETYDVADLETLAADCLTRAGVSAEVAESVARDVALSEAAGHSDHGIAALLRDIRALRYGRLHADAEVQVEQPAPTVFRIDAAHGFAAAAMAKVAPMVAEATKTQGMAMAHLSRASDTGLMAGAMADLAQAGLLAISVREGGASAVIVPGARHVMRLDRTDNTMLNDLLNLAPPVVDTPVGGPVSHSGWLYSLNPAVVAMEALLAHLPVPTGAPKAGGIRVASDLLAQIVTA